MDYPKHLLEKIREEVTVSYLKHEFRKIFPSIDEREIENLMNNKELCNPRDFWNGLHGISMGFKLKNILYLVTAENVNWVKLKMDINELGFGVELDCTKIVREGKILAEELEEFYRQNPDKKQEQLVKIVEIRGNDIKREGDPIIAIEKEENGKKIIRVYDGNGRLARHIAEGKREIEVYLGRLSGDRLKNYWLPTNLLMDNLYFVYQAIEDKDEELFQQQMAVIKNMLNFSESGKVEFIERALSKKELYYSKILGTM